MFTKKTFQNLPKTKQERITRVAMEEFGNKGFEGASINTMVDKLKIAKGSIFQYFGDKKGLFLFVFEQSVERVKNHLRKVRDQSRNDPLEIRLRKTLAAGIDFIRQHPLLYRMYLRMFVESKLPFREEILRSLRGNSIDFLGELLEDARKNGELRTGIDIEKTTFLLDAVMDRFLQAHLTPHLDAGLGIYQAPEDRIDIWIGTLADVICRGISVADPVSDHSPSAPYLLVTAAVEKELAPLLARMEDLKAETGSVRRIYYGKIADIPVRLAETGPGMVNAVQTITALAEKCRPAAILVTGCGGAFKGSGLGLGDVALASEEIDAHLGLETGDGAPHAPLPFAVLHAEKTSLTNRYPMDNLLMDRAWQILQTAFDAASGIRTGKGPFLTVSTITATEETAGDYQKAYAPCMEQMEGAGAAHVAAFYGIPFLEVRGVSNFVGPRDRNAWDISLASDRSCAAVYAIISGMGEEMLKQSLKEIQKNLDELK